MDSSESSEEETPGDNEEAKLTLDNNDGK